MLSFFRSQPHLVLLFVLFLCAIGVAYVSIEEDAAQETSLFKVYFLDVGQGDATLIESPYGTQVLIDGGPDSSVLRELGDIIGFLDRDIDMVIATHPDKDHIGGLIDVLERYDVRTILLTQNESDTPVAELFIELVEAEGAEIIYARDNQTFTFDGAELRILFPDREARGLESNASSIVAQLIYGETVFLFTGDSPQSIEKYLVSVYGSGLESDVLKVGHHGSKTSTASAFAAAVSPQYAVISAGKDNSYGHPHQEVLDTLSGVGAETNNTANLGSILFESNGVDVWFK